MKLMLVFVVAIAIIANHCHAAPQGNQEVTIISSESENIGIGGYKFSYEQSDGTIRTEEATVNNAGTEEEYLTIRGTVSWIAPDGQRYTVEFVADENGYQPTGDHIPK